MVSIKGSYLGHIEAYTRLLCKYTQKFSVFIVLYRGAFLHVSADDISNIMAVILTSENMEKVIN